MGLFGWGKAMGGYRRRRETSPPDGWLEAHAVVEACESEKTTIRVGSGDDQAWVYRTVATYVVLDQDDAPLPIVAEERLRSGDRPKVGERLVIAYDPAGPTEVVVLVGETEYADRLRARVRQAIQHGTQAPCEVVAAAPTGRVSYRTETAPAPEVWLTLRVAPSGDEPFEISLSLWDRGFDLRPGTRGTLLYVAGEHELGYPVFPDARQRAADGDAVRVARDEFVESMTPKTVQVSRGLTISTGGSTPLDG